MEPKIGTLTIERFRAFRKLKIEGLGRVNLITGRNNTGKSSVLEALRMLATDGVPIVIYDILWFREEISDETDMAERPFDRSSFLPLSGLFNGFPEFPTEIQPIVITSTDGQRNMKLTLQTNWGSSDGSMRSVQSQEEDEELPAIRVTADTVTGSVKHVLRLYGRRWFLQPFTPRKSLPCLFLSPCGGGKTAPLGALWDKIALSEREKDVVEALHIIDADISAVSMVGGEGPRQERTAIVRSTRLPRPVSLRSFGDGLNRLFGIILFLVNAKDGFLLIDEFENGMHHTVQADAWRIIFKLASRLDIQVFATSHSWDAIEAFQEAASESPEEGVLVRLSRKGEDIIPTVFRKDELAIATRDRIEVR